MRHASQAAFSGSACDREKSSSFHTAMEGTDVTDLVRAGSDWLCAPPQHRYVLMDIACLCGLGIDCLFVGIDCLCGLGSRSEPHTGGADHRRDRPTAPQPPAIASVEMSPDGKSRRRSRRSAPPSRRRSGKSTSPSRRRSRSTRTNGPLSGQRSRCAESINVAPPRTRNRENIEAAINDFKQRFHNSPVQHE